jgi:hypothetical protein
MSSHDGFAGGAARQTRRYVEDWPSTASPDSDPLDVRFQRAACEPIGRIHNLRRIPPNKEQSAATCNTMRSARSNAAVAAWAMPACPASIAFSASLACARGASAR